MNLKKNKMISIIIPVFNRKSKLKTTIDSIIQQTYANWELLLVDDGSKNDTIELLKNYELNETRVKLIKRNRLPKGPSTCRNIGAKRAKGEYLVFWDSDDIMAPWCLQTRMDFLENNPNLDFAFYQLLNFDEVNGSISLRCNINNAGSDIEKYIEFRHGGSTQTVCWRKLAFRNAGGWSENILLWEDAELHCRAMLKGLKFSHSYNLADGFVRVNQDEDSLTSDNNAKAKILSAIKVFQSLANLINDYKMVNKLQSNVIAKIYARSFFLHRKEIKEIATKAYGSMLFTKKRRNEFVRLFTIYSFVKYIPYLRRPFYKLIKSKYVIKKGVADFKFDDKSKKWLMQEINNLNKETRLSFISLLPENVINQLNI